MPPAPPVTHHKPLLPPQITALANLLPPDAATDELDSYMYQTVGHQLVEAYAACTGRPLYRRRIMGGARSQGLTYSATDGDEVEDLLALLAFVKVGCTSCACAGGYCVQPLLSCCPAPHVACQWAHAQALLLLSTDTPLPNDARNPVIAAPQARHPEIEAVASGAIASDYQRLRVEDVCARLGLVSLGYLWHRPQEELLRCARVPYCAGACTASGLLSQAASVACAF